MMRNDVRGGGGITPRRGPDEITPRTGIQDEVTPEIGIHDKITPRKGIQDDEMTQRITEDGVVTKGAQTGETTVGVTNLKEEKTIPVDHHHQNHPRVQNHGHFLAPLPINAALETTDETLADKKTASSPMADKTTTTMTADPTAQEKKLIRKLKKHKN